MWTFVLRKLFDPKMTLTNVKFQVVTCLSLIVTQVTGMPALHVRESHMLL